MTEPFVPYYRALLKTISSFRPLYQEFYMLSQVLLNSYFWVKISVLHLTPHIAVLKAHLWVYLDDSN